MENRSITRARTLLRKYYDASASTAEERELLDILADNEDALPSDLQEEYDFLRTLDAAGEADEAADRECIEFASRHIDTLAAAENICRRNIRRFIPAAAAAIAVIVAITVWLPSGDSREKLLAADSAKRENVLTPTAIPASVPAEKPSVSATHTPLLAAETPVVKPKRRAVAAPKRVAPAAKAVEAPANIQIADSAAAIASIESAFGLVAESLEYSEQATQAIEKSINKSLSTISTFIQHEKDI